MYSRVLVPPVISKAQLDGFFISQWSVSGQSMVSGQCESIVIHFPTLAGLLTPITAVITRNGHFD